MLLSLALSVCIFYREGYLGWELRSGDMPERGKDMDDEGAKENTKSCLPIFPSMP